MIINISFHDEKLDIPVLGVILPGASAAIKASQHGTIGIIGTPMTIQSDIYLTKNLFILKNQTF